MSTLRVNTIQDTAGSGTPAINGLAKAWVNFDGTNTVAIRASMNVSSITDNGVGDYTMNFTTALVDANYCVSSWATASSGSSSVHGVVGNPDISPLQTGSLRINTRSTGGSYDSSIIGISVFR